MVLLQHHRILPAARSCSVVGSYLAVDRIGSSDIKDKSQLMESRKAVERQMERFKVKCHMPRHLLTYLPHDCVFPSLSVPVCRFARKR